MRSPAHCTSCCASVGAGGCPPSCQPISGHCRVRQSGHFLETGSLPLPLAALRRFPRRPDRIFPAPTAGHTGPALQGVALSGPGGQLPAVRRGGVLPRPPTLCRTSGRAHGPCPTKMRVGRDPYVPPPTNHRTPCKKPVIAKPVRTLAVAIRNSKDPTRQKRPAPGRSFPYFPYITIYSLLRLILTPLEDLQNVVEMALLLFQLRLFLRGNALRRLLGGLLCLRGSLSGHRL